MPRHHHPTLPPYRILCLDGGGIRGVMTSIWLDQLEQKLNCNEKKPLYSCFDLIAGTSTGALLACAVASGIPAREVIRLYRDQGSTIFPPMPERLLNRLGRIFSQGLSAPKYDPASFYSALQNLFGNRTIGSLTTPTLLFAYDTERRTPVVFKNHAPKDSGSDTSDVPLWKACAASSAAPTYFPAFVMDVPSAGVRPLIDGGVVANNPTACAIAEGVRRQHDKWHGAKARDYLSSMLVVSMGTGSLTRPISRQEAMEWGAIEWALPVIDVLFDGATDAVDYIATHILDEGHYFRFQTELNRASDALDDASAQNIAELEKEARMYAQRPDVTAKITQVARRLQKTSLKEVA